MLAFAANSLLCRRALGGDLIDAASFTSLRILSGALMLAVITAPRWRRRRPSLDWKAAAALSAYMVFFSFAYLTLNAGTGALLLFGAVQLTMFAAALQRGERFTPLAWAGVLLAFAGLVYLLLPGLAAPNPVGAILMLVAGVSWGLYSLLGASAEQPLMATTGNFLLSIPVALGLGLAFIDAATVTATGLLLAVASGALASGIGYAIWYAALAGLSSGHAATVQLSVPVIAALGGVVLLAEPASLRLVVASVLTLGGIWLVLSRRGREGV
jgi:drug/metabolite transporter (DMT)-like permease